MNTEEEVAPELTATEVTLHLTRHERTLLAVAAAEHAQLQNDPRFANPDPVQRSVIGARWRTIAQLLDPP